MRCRTIGSPRTCAGPTGMVAQPPTVCDLRLLVFADLALAGGHGAPVQIQVLK